jgi:hypothetical protein
MSNQEIPVPMGTIDPSTLVSFAFVVEGDVAFCHKIPPNAENALIALNSQPQIIQVPAELSASVVFGWRYVDGEFLPPIV